METPKNPEIIKLMVTIVDRGNGVKAVDLYRAEHLHFDFICLGRGTASSRILDYLGLSATEKDIVLTMVPASRIPLLKIKADAIFHLKQPGHGILFTLPLSGISAQIPQVLCKPEYREESEVKQMENATQYDLIMTIINRGYTDKVIDAARAAGARGGTVLSARRVGYQDAENFLGFTIQPEKEVVAILTPRSEKQTIMRAISKEAGLTTECRGILFSLQVDDIMGLRETGIIK